MSLTCLMLQSTLGLIWPETLLPCTRSVPFTPMNSAPWATREEHSRCVARNILIHWKHSIDRVQCQTCVILWLCVCSMCWKSCWPSLSSSSKNRCTTPIPTATGSSTSRSLSVTHSICLRLHGVASGIPACSTFITMATSIPDYLATSISLPFLPCQDNYATTEVKQKAWGLSPTLTTFELFPQQLHGWLCPIIWVLLFLLFLQLKWVPVVTHKAQHTIEEPLPKRLFVCSIRKHNWHEAAAISITGLWAIMLFIL